MSKVFSDWIGSPHEFFDNYVEYSDAEKSTVKEFLKKKAGKIITSSYFKIAYKPPYPAPEHPPNQQQVDIAVMVLSKCIKGLYKEELDMYIDCFVERDGDYYCERAHLDDQDRWDVLDAFFSTLINNRLEYYHDLGVISENVPFSLVAKFKF